jgi:hypothetical protein
MKKKAKTNFIPAQNGKNGPLELPRLLEIAKGPAKANTASLSEKVTTTDPTAVEAVNIYLRLEGTPSTEMITIPKETACFDDLKRLAEKKFGPVVILYYRVDDYKLGVDDDDSLGIFFRTHQGRELKLFCVKKMEEDAIGEGTADSRGEIDIASNVRDEFWQGFTYTGQRVRLPRPPAAKKHEKEHLQSAYDKWATPSGKVVSEVVAKGGSSPVTIECRGVPFKPAITIFDKDNSESPVSIAAIIELTDPSNGDSAPSPDALAFERIAAHLRAILRLTPGRAHIYGILTNHRYLVFVKAQRTRNCVKYIRHYAGPFTEDYLQWILHASLDDLGLRKWEVMLGGKKHVLRNYLGSGRYSIGFEVEHPIGNSIVVKYFADLNDAFQERDVCSKLEGIEGVTQLAEVQPNHIRFIAVTPKGLPFNDTDRRLTRNHVLCLRQALRALHREGLAHNDVVPCNIYYLDANRALLADWSNVTKGSPTKSTHDFWCLAVAVKELGGCGDLMRIAIEGVRKRRRVEVVECEEEEEEEPDAGRSCWFSAS